MRKNRRTHVVRSRSDLQAAFVTRLSPRPKVSLRKPVSLVKRSRMTTTPVMAGDTAVGAFYAGMSHEEFMAGMGWGRPAPSAEPAELIVNGVPATQLVWN